MEKTLAIHLAELREQIAKEIEEMLVWEPCQWVVETAAKLARGK